VTPFPSFPQIQSTDFGEGEWKVFMKNEIQIQDSVVPPQKSVFDFGGGAEGGRGS
jgi:hypothetical protein